MDNKYIRIILFLSILLLGAVFRFTGLNWDDNHHLHPDERFLTMVATAMKWPNNVFQYLDTTNSKLNPHNIGYSFYVYGTFPIILVKAVAELLGKGDYINLTLVGRAVSGIVDLGTMILVFLITDLIVKHLNRGNKNKPDKPLFSFLNSIFRHPKSIINHQPSIVNYSPYLAMFLYAVTTLSIQLSHFFTVDPYLTFFSSLTIYFLLKKGIDPLVGISMALAVSTKISAILLLPVIILSVIIQFINNFKNNRSASRSLLSTLYSLLLFIIFFYLAIRLFYPYLFASENIFDLNLNSKVLANWNELKSFDNKLAPFPPAVQWVHTKPLIFPFLNTVFWGFGIPLSIIVITGLFIYLFKYPLNSQLLLLISTISVVFIYNGIQFAKPLRYLHPIYPLLSVFGGIFIYQEIIKSWKKYSMLLSIILLILLLLWPIAFLSIYIRPHSRVSASKWIYDNIPRGSTIGVEHWDDGLPLSIGNRGYGEYEFIEIPVYNPDNSEKRGMLLEKKSKADYIILTSNRAFGSLTSLPDRYPIMMNYYTSLFREIGNYKKIAEFTSRPNIPIPFINICITPPFFKYGIVSASNDCPLRGISFIDDYADETWTVYDHPKVIIFKKII